MLYPLFLEPVYKSIIWGGRNLEKVLNRKLPEGNIAESWEVCCHKNGTNIILNGEFEGMLLSDLFKSCGKELCGEKCADLERFPLLIKFIDANDKLSIQVHPDNDYALKAEGDLGKTEMWYIIDAKENAQLVYGTAPGITKGMFKDAIAKGDLEKYLNYVDVKKGDVVFIPSGTVHAILDGILIAEIQQNSDTTYRVYDWNRVDKNGNPRELHIEKALDVINFEFAGRIEDKITEIHNGYGITRLIECEFFKVDKVSVSGIMSDSTDGSTFFAFTAIEGNGSLIYNGTEYKIETGSSFIIPAALGEFTIKGNMTLLKSYL